MANAWRARERAGHDDKAPARSCGRFRPIRRNGESIRRSGESGGEIGSDAAE
jgi:hypothetical protein